MSLTLCDVRLMNDAQYPWLMMVPRRAEAVELLDLAPDDQLQLFDELRHCARVMRMRYRPDKLNIAALGNLVPQLHVHVVARFRADPAWPRPVWGVLPPVLYDDARAATESVALRALLTPTVSDR
jgi:diadenosine tetraphosphate (Ap4A) HIT family hydrolase